MSFWKTELNISPSGISDTPYISVRSSLHIDHIPCNDEDIPSNRKDFKKARLKFNKTTIALSIYKVIIKIIVFLHEEAGLNSISLYVKHRDHVF